MRKTRTEVIEDALVGGTCTKAEKLFTVANPLQLPVTISFTGKGEYRVVIKDDMFVVTKEK